MDEWKSTTSLHSSNFSLVHYTCQTSNPTYASQRQRRVRVSIRPRWDMVIRMGIPRDVVTSFQERGRNARKDGMTGVYLITTDWVGYVKLLMTIVLPPGSEKATPEYKEVNSAITSPNRSTSKWQRLSDVALTSTEQQNNRASAYADHVACVNLYCLPELGCVHARSEWIMYSGKMQQPPPSITPCLTQCHVCDGIHLQTFLPIIFSGALSFMKSSTFGAG